MNYYYYRCQECRTGYINDEKPERCACGSTDFKKSRWFYPKLSWVTRFRKKLRSFAPSTKVLHKKEVRAQ